MIEVGSRPSRMRLLAIGAVLVSLAGSAVASGSSADATSYYPANPQIGTRSTDSTDQYATGAEAFVGHYPTPENIPDISNTALAWWSGITLPDGSFLQVGLISGGTFGCNSNYGVFVQTYRPDGTMANNWGGQNKGTCGTYVTGYGQFVIQSSVLCSSCSPEVYRWKFYEPYNGWGNSQYYDTIESTTGTNKPGVVMELTTLSGTANMADQMGPAGAYPATLTQHGIGGAYYDTYSAVAYINHPTDCPPGTVAGEDQGFNPGYIDRVGAGTPASYFNYPCIADGTALWQ